MAMRTPGEDDGEAPFAGGSPTAADLADIVDICDDAILMVDGARRILFTNKSAQALFGYARSEILGKPLEQLLHDRDHEELRRLLATARGAPKGHARVVARRLIAGLRRDGCEFSAEMAIAKPVRAEDENRLTVMVRAINERQQTERLLKLKSDALDDSLTAFGIVGLNGQFIYLNRTYLKLWGYEWQHEIVGASPAQHCVDPSVPLRIIETVKRHGECTLEFTARRKDGSTFETLLSVRKSTNEQGDEIYIGTALDLTERKQAEAKLAAQKDLLETILQQAADAIVVCDAQDNPILINAAARRLALTDSRDHAESSPKYLWGKAYYPDGHAIPLQAWPLQQALRGNTTVGAEARVVRADGSYHDVLISAAPIHNIQHKTIGAVAIFSDITERKQVEERLLYQLRLTQGITDSATESIFVTNAKGEVTFFNPEARRVFGFTPEEIIGRSLHDTIHHHYPDGRPIPVEECFLGRIYLTGESVRDHEDVFQRKDGAILTMSCSNALLENKGKRLGAVFFMRDVTERRRNEKALRESAARLRAIVNAVPDLLLVLDQDGRYLEILSQPQLLYTDPAALKGRLIGEILPPEDAKRALKVIRQTLTNRRPQSFEYELKTRKAGKRSFEVRTAPLDGLLLGRPAVVLLARDITQHRLTESSLRHAQKMEAVGQLTGGIAHDFNNLLAVILGNLELLAEALNDPSLIELVQRALGAVERGTTLIRRLLTFSRQQPLQPVPVNLNTLVIGLSDLVRRSLGETIEVKTVLAPNLLPTLIDSHEFESALLNLVVNARDAMPNGGQLILETANRWVGKELARQQLFQVEPGQYVTLSVSDTGTGMTPEVLEHAFEPFFTTKQIGQGSGLGLSMVYGLVKESGGHIHIYSELGQGTAIRIFLPATQAKTGAAVETGASERPIYAGQGQTILVVEDEAQVRRLAVHMLQGLGYETFEADNAASALTILQETPRIVLLFTDVVLPGGVSGVDLAGAALQQRPDLAVLFTSGYTETHLAHFRGRPAGSEFLSKPYRKAELANKLHDLLLNRAARPLPE
ncbi:MAG: PAS domain S-box protein [Candidatus Competibacteraceae bacterium]|nr:PAS domain S-box protein [Candidatus Competibacteraceae bacterium]